MDSVSSLMRSPWSCDSPDDAEAADGFDALIAERGEPHGEHDRPGLWAALEREAVGSLSAGVGGVPERRVPTRLGVRDETNAVPVLDELADPFGRLAVRRVHPDA